MSVDSFIDTNILLYDIDDSDKDKHAIATDMVRKALETDRFCISYQVVQECLSAGLRKAHIPLTPTLAQAYLNTVLLPLWRVHPSKALYQQGIDIQARYQFSFYDSLIVAAALEAGCKTLYSEDLQDGQRIEHLTIRNPFTD